MRDEQHLNGWCDSNLEADLFLLSWRLLLNGEHLCEMSSIQSLASKTPEQQLAAVAEAIVSMGHNVNQFYKDVKHRYFV